MKVVSLCGSGLDDIYALLQEDDWGLGMPEGLAHWDGAQWRWIRRLDDRRVTEMTLDHGRLILLNTNGRIEQRSPGGEWAELMAPQVQGPLDGPDRGLWYGYEGMSALGRGCIGLVGHAGAFAVLEDGVFRRVETQTTEALTSIRGVPPHCFICGLHGVLLRFDGSTCSPMKLHGRGDYCKIDEAPDGTVFAAGSCDQSKSGILLRLENHGDGPITEYAAPIGLFSVAALSHREVYCSTTGYGVLAWDGHAFTQSLPREVAVGRMCKVGGHVAMGTGPRGAKAVFHSPPHWQRIPLTLDEAFLMDD